ncbi:MAG: hypothetical protein K1W39_07345 [Lachnospiraceae bacterium]
MGNVISFQKAKKKKEKKFNQNKKKSKTVTEKSTTGYPVVLNPLKEDSSINMDYAEMKPEDKIEYWKNIEKEEEERFKEKYKDVLAAVPVNAGARMQYFAKVMLHLLPNVFHGSSWDARFDTCMDFCQFYITEFDSAYSDYIKVNKEFERPYHYKFHEMAAEKLEEELEDCLGKIIELCPEKKEEDKTEMLYQAARLFELKDLLSDLFYKEVTKD